MEKERRRHIHSEEKIRKRDIVISTVFVAALSVGLKTAATYGDQPSLSAVYPESDFKPVILHQDKENIVPDYMSHSNIIVEFPSLEKTPPETEGQKLLNTYVLEANQIAAKMEASGGKVGEKTIEDVRMYYPIYKAVADHYGIDWVALLVTHEAETGGSRSTKAFNGSSYPYFGAIQRDVSQWSDSLVKKDFNDVFSNIPEVAKIPTRNKTDARELSFAGDNIARNFHQYEDLGKERALFNAFKLFTASDALAEKRLNQVILIDGIISESIQANPQTLKAN